MRNHAESTGSWEPWAETDTAAAPAEGRQPSWVRTHGHSRLSQPCVTTTLEHLGLRYLSATSPRGS